MGRRGEVTAYRRGGGERSGLAKAPLGKDGGGEEL